MIHLVVCLKKKLRLFSRTTAIYLKCSFSTNGHESADQIHLKRGACPLVNVHLNFVKRG